MTRDTIAYIAVLILFLVAGTLGLIPDVAEIATIIATVIAAIVTAIRTRDPRITITVAVLTAIIVATGSTLFIYWLETS